MTAVGLTSALHRGDAVRGKLTRDSIRRLAVPLGRRDVYLWDPDLHGFGVRALRSGRKSYVVNVKEDGRPRRRVLGTTQELSIEQARDAARRLLGQSALANAGDPRADVRDVPTLRQAADRWIREFERLVAVGERRQRTLVEHRRYIERDLQPLHDRRVDRIRREEIVNVLNATREKRGRASGDPDASGVATSNRVLATVSGLFSWMIDEGIVDTSPIAGRRKKPEGNDRRDPLTVDEVRRAYAAACDGSPGGDVIRLLVLTGCRRQEIGGLLPHEVNCERRSLELPDERVKGRIGYAVPLVGDAWSVVEARLDRRTKKGDRPFRSLFGRRVEAAGFEGWSQLAADFRSRTGITTLSMHDFRRAFSTHANELELAEPHVIDAELNHRAAVGRGGVAGLYNLASYYEPRKRLLEAWHEVVIGRRP